MPSKPLLTLAGLISLVAFVVVPAALADQVFHTSHAAVHAVAGAPLKSGFVNDIHSNGAVNSAREEYHLNGAQPNTSYEVHLLFYEDPSCAGSPSSFTTAVLTTNAAGNGNADVTFAASPPNNPPLQVEIVWQFTANGSAVYATDCVPVSID